MPSPAKPEKRKPGRPKGTKNKPGTKNVGRPRKDGAPPRARDACEAILAAITGIYRLTDFIQCGMRRETMLACLIHLVPARSLVVRRQSRGR